MKKIVIIFLIISLIIPFYSVRTSFSQNIQIPKGWSLVKDYQKIPVTLQNETYYAYEIQKKEDNNKSVHGWLITDSNNNIVSDEKKYKNLAFAATVSKYTKKLNESATIENELKDLESLNWKLKGLEIASASLKSFTSIISAVLYKQLPKDLIEEIGSIPAQHMLPEDKNLGNEYLQTFTKLMGTNLSDALTDTGIVIGDTEMPLLKFLSIFKLAMRRSILEVSRGGVQKLKDANKILKKDGEVWSYEDASKFFNEYKEGQIRSIAYGSWYIRLLPSSSDIVWNDIFKQLFPTKYSADLTDLIDACMNISGVIESNPSSFGYNEVEKDIKIISSSFDLYKVFSDTSIKDSPASKAYSAIIASLRGTLSVSSIPKGAKVYVNGQYKGITPIDITLTSGNYNIELTEKGYNNYTKDVTISQGKITKLPITLVKLSSNGFSYDIGDQVQAVDYLNVRKEPSLKGTVIVVVKKGSIGIIESACKIADNYHWWIVRWDNGYEGWSAGEYMRRYTDKPPDLSWDRRASMPTSRAYTGIATYNGKIYVVGGCSSPSSSQQFYNATKTLEVYNPLNNTWKTLAPMSTPMVGPAVAALNGKIYVMGGFNRNTWSADSTMEIYDIATNTWAAGPPMLTPRSWGRAVTLNGKIYVLGGVGYGYRNNCEVFDPSKQAWSRCASFNTGRYLFAAVVAKGKIYIMGGGSYDPCQTEACHKVFSDVQVYDPSTNSWTNKTPMPTPASSIDAVVVNDTILVFGGGGLCRAYDITNDIWKEKISNQNPSGAFSIAYLNGVLYRFGGGGWGPTLDIVERCLYSTRP